MKVMRRNLARRMAGLTLLETLFAIVLGVLVTLGAILFFSSGKQSTNANRIVTDINSIVAGYDNYLATGQTLTAKGDPCPTDGTAGSTCSYYIISDAGYLPTALMDPLGSPYKISYSGAASATSGTIAIQIGGVSANDALCTTISTMIPTATGSVSAGGVGSKIPGGTGTCTATMNL